MSTDDSVQTGDDPKPPDVPERSWTNPFTPGTPLHDHFKKIVEENRDLIILLDDYRGSRGTGKTIASMQLAEGMDQTAEGLIWEKCSLEPEEVRNAYASQPKRSGLILDEGEVGASNRDAMSKTNKALREIMSMGRVEQKYVVVNTPAIEFIDKDIQKLADVWISMVRKGQGLVHWLQREPYSGTLLRPKKQMIEFDDIPRSHELREVYRKLSRAKQKKIRGDDGNVFIGQQEHQEELRQAKKKARREMRNEIIHGLMNHPEIQECGVSQRMVAEAIGVSQGTVSNNS
jgi:hypothetical protein